MDVASSSRGRDYYFQYRDNDVFTKFTIDLRIKNGVAVDPQSCHVQDAHVYCNKNGTIYSAYLTSTDVENWKNSYYKLQILEIDESTYKSSGWYDGITSYWLFQTHGGIGAAGYMYNETQMPIRDAVREFERIFLNLTGNTWENRNNFVRLWNKMNMLEIVYTPNLVDDKNVTSQLEESVQSVVKLLVKSSTKELPKIQSRDSKKWPMGILSEKHIDEASEVLGQLLNCVYEERHGIDEKTVIRSSNKYYSLIPRGLELRGLKLLDTPEAIQDEFEFLDSLPRDLKKVSLTDALYANLSTKLHPLDPNEPLYEIIKISVRNTCIQNNWNVEVVEIFGLDRHGENQRYLDFKHLGNKKLLWHGSPLQNYTGILSQGLSLRAARGGCFGAGIYFSDMVAKALHYCRVHYSSGETFACLLLCEVALGNIESSPTNITYRNSSNLLSMGYDSILGCGTTTPDPKDDIQLKDGLVFAFGRGVPSPSTNSCSRQYNEYVVYREAQVKMQYLVQIKLKSKCMGNVVPS